MIIQDKQNNNKGAKMKKTINLKDFRQAFKDANRDNFSYEGYEVLFDYLVECEGDTGDEMELDVIGICCDFYEIHALELAKEHEGEEVLEIVEKLREQTTVLKSGINKFIIQAY